MNTLSVITFLTVTLAIAIISWWVTRKEDLASVEGYYLGGRNLGWFLVGGSLFLSNISAIAIVGETESAYLSNMTVMMYGFASIFAMAIVSEFVLPIYLRFGVTTTPEFLGLRFDPTVTRWVAILLLLAYVINLMPPVLYTGAVVLNGMFDIDGLLGIEYWTAIWILVWLIGIVGSAYAIFGGLKAIAASDALNGVGLVLGGILVPYFGLRYLGDGNVLDGWQHVVTKHPDHMNAWGRPDDAVPWTTLFTGMLLVNLNYWGAEQYILQRSLGSRNLTEGQKGMMFGAALKFIAPFITVFPGVIALAIFPTLTQSNEAYSALVTGVMPAYLIGLMAAIMFGASLTTFNSGLNSTSTMAVLNLYKPYKEKKGELVDDKKLIAMGKGTQVILAIIAMIIAPFIYFASDGFYDYFQKVAGLFSIPIFTIVIVGMATKRVPSIGAKVALITYLVGYGYTQMINDYGLHFLHWAAIFFVIGVCIMLVFGVLKPRAVPFAKPTTSAVSLAPWKWRWWAYGITISAMIAVTVWLSPLGIATW